MKRMLRSRTNSSNAKWVLAASVLLALIISPFAMAAGEGKPVQGGKRNPSANASQAFTAETQVIANNDTYGTRQSNKGGGGGAIYGCRSAVGAEACLRGANLNAGLAFSFGTAGNTGGVITAVGGDNAKPFTTNATGVATGLNADRVDSLNASDIVSQGADAGAKSAVTTVTNAIQFASVASNGTLGASRGVTSSSRSSDGTYNVVFTGDISKCVFQATESTTDNAGAAAFSIGSDNKTVSVTTRAGGDGGAGTGLADRPFHLQATCLS
jgi:hypothetical protein